MLLIFLASSQVAEESTELSEGLTHSIVGTAWRWFASEGQMASEQFLDDFEVVLRKAAHLFAFAVLGFCTAKAVRCLTEKRRLVFWVSLGWGSVYGVLDELHQYFVPGRACMWQDWVIDTVGAAIGAAVVVLWRRSAPLL